MIRTFRSTPFTERDGTRGIDTRHRPPSLSEGGERRTEGSHEVLWGIDPGYHTKSSLVPGGEPAGWPTAATPPPPTREEPPKIVMNITFYRELFDCETYALDNKSFVYTRRQARILGRCKKDVAQSFGVGDEWDGTPPAKVFQFLPIFAKAYDDNAITEFDAFHILLDFTKEPLKSDVTMVMPSCRGGNPGEATSYLELISWMLRRHAHEASVATLVEMLIVAVQRDDEDELSFAERLRRLNTECRFMSGIGAFKGRFVEGVHRAARATVRERNTPAMTLAELVRITQTKGDELRWLEHEQRKERVKEHEALAEESRQLRIARLGAALRVPAAAPRVPAPVRRYAPRGNASRAVAAADGKAPTGDDQPRPRAREGETACWQCGKGGHCAKECPYLEARLRERLAGAFRWSLAPAAPRQSG